MRSLEEIKDYVANKYGYFNWYDVLSTRGAGTVESLTDELIKLYAIEVAKQALINASVNAKIYKSGNSGSFVDASINKQSILSETNIPKLD